MTFADNSVKLIDITQICRIFCVKSPNRLYVLGIKPKSTRLHIESRALIIYTVSKPTMNPPAARIVFDLSIGILLENQCFQRLRCGFVHTVADTNLAA